MFSLRHPPRSLGDLLRDIRRIALGTAYALRPRRLPALPAVAAASARAALGLEPDVTRDPVPRHRLGFVGVCRGLDPESLMRGFSKGLYPFSHIGAKKWWMLPERMTMQPHEVVRDKDVRRMIRNRRFAIAFDTAFEEVMRACAAPRRGHAPLTWITEDIVEAYVRLHRAGHAHSFEARDADANLVGGGFGIAVGGVFVVESQFTTQRNASKVAFVTLMRHLSHWGFLLVDGKGRTAYLESMGFRPTSHEEYLELLDLALVPAGVAGAWRLDETLDPSQDWGPAEPLRRLADAARGSEPEAGLRPGLR